MANRKAKMVLALCCLGSFCLLPALGQAVLKVQTAMVSGRIVAHHDNHAVKLDNGVLYRPSRKGLQVNLRSGEVVTLRYYKAQNGELVFFEYAAGANSLPPLPSDQPRPARVVQPGY